MFSVLLTAVNRRHFSKSLFATVMSYALLDSLFAYNAISSKILPITQHWATQLNAYCLDLKKNNISPVEWQAQISELYKHIDMNELLKFIDFEQLAKGFQYHDLGANTRKVIFPKLNGLPERTAFVKKVIGLKKDRAIIPHGHSNMASCHLIVQGDFHLRQYEKIGQEDEFLIINPTIDTSISVGDSSTISDDKNNVHWFVAESETAFTFDVIALDLNEQSYDIHNLDMDKKEAYPNGMLRVPTLSVEEGLKKYGKTHHH